MLISHYGPSVQFSQLSRVQLLATPWTAAHQASMSITNSWSLLKLMSIELVMPFSHLILCHPLLLPPSVILNSPKFYGYDFLYIQFNSVTQSCLTLCDAMDCSTPGFPVHHQLPELTQTHVYHSVRPSHHLILCHPLLLPPSIFPDRKSTRLNSSHRIASRMPSSA